MSNGEIVLRDRLASLVQSMGYEWVGCELQRQGRGSVLRIFIDNERGITLDDCSRVSHQVSALLDVEDPIQGEYTLEVSSPGINRPLFGIEQYQKFVGNKVKIRLHTPIDTRRNLLGMLLRVEGTNIHLLVEAEEVVLPFSYIEKGKIIADIR